MKPGTTILILSVMVGMVAVVSGCGLGASTIGRDRLDYEAALTVSWQRQVLNNIVKLRYGDTPAFLEVGSVINQYELVSLVSVNAPAWNKNPSNEFPMVGASAQYADRPTITYSPILGDKFAKSLLTPIPPGTVMSLVQSGWPVSYVFPITVSAINGINNRSYTHFLGRKEDPQFMPLLERLRRLQLSPAVSMRIIPPKEGETGETTMMLLGGRTMSEAVKADLKAVLETLGLNPEATQISLVYGLLPANDREIALQTRSVIEIFGELAGGIEVPAVHVAEQRVRQTRFGKGSPEGEVEPLMKVHSSVDRPEAPFIAVKYRDHWFWVDDRDLQSKFMFTFLMLLTNLAEKGVVPAAPLLTIPSR